MNKKGQNSARDILRINNLKKRESSKSPYNASQKKLKTDNYRSKENKTPRGTGSKDKGYNNDRKKKSSLPFENGLNWNELQKFNTLDQNFGFEKPNFQSVQH